MKDKMPTQDIHSIKIPELEGHVKIELFNAKTGELEQCVEGKNMITDAIKDIFSSNYFGLINYERLFPLIDVFFGGILCFADPLTENVKNYYPPNSSNPLTAHAGQVNYDAPENDPTRGSPGVDIPVTNGISRKFAFAETQGNGPISAIAMTHSDTGSYWLFNGTSFNPYLVLSSHNNSIVDGPTLFFDRTRRLAYVLTGSGTNLTVRVLANYGCINDVGLMQRQPNADHSDAISSNTYTMPTNFYNCRYMYFEEEREIHCLYPNGHTIYRRIIDLSDMSVASSDVTVANEYTFTNYGDEANSSVHVVCVPATLDVDGYMYARGSNVLYRIKYSRTSTTFADIQETPIQLGGTYNENYTASNGIGHWNYSPGSMRGPYGVISDGTNAYPVYNQQLTWGTGAGAYINGMSIDNQLVLWTPRTSRDTLGYMEIVLNKMFMSTVKNLAQPVTKLSTQTMNITYTITEATE